MTLLTTIYINDNLLTEVYLWNIIIWQIKNIEMYEINLLINDIDDRVAQNNVYNLVNPALFYKISAQCFTCWNQILYSTFRHCLWHNNIRLSSYSVNWFSFPHFNLFRSKNSKYIAFSTYKVKISLQIS